MPLYIAFLHFGVVLIALYRSMLKALWLPILSAKRHQRQRGGWRQIEAAPLANDEDEVFSISRLAAGHLLDWAEGSQSAAKLRYHMDNAAQDDKEANQRTHPMVRRLAEVRSGQNAHAGIMS